MFVALIIEKNANYREHFRNRVQCLVFIDEMCRNKS